MIDQEQFVAAYPMLFDRISRYVYFRIHHRQDAEDIISNTLLKLYKQMSAFDGDKGNLEQYAVGIARYTIIDYWRSHTLTYSLDEITEVFTHADRLQADQSLDQTMAFEKLMQALPPDVQALFALHYEDGLTYQHIAEMVQKKPATIRKLFSLMHKKLRKQFAL